MLIAFIIENRQAIILGSRARVASRTARRPTDLELTNGIPMFLDQLAAALTRAAERLPHDHVDIDLSAHAHGSDLFYMGFTIGQVVHDYGDVCQAISELATDQCALIPWEQFRTLNSCLDDAIAAAMSSYYDQSQARSHNEGVERLGMLAHELRNSLNVCMLAYDAIQGGHVAVRGATGMVLARGLTGLQNLIDRSLAEVRLDAGIVPQISISVASFVEELEIGANLMAHSKGVTFTATHVDPVVTIAGDRSALLACVSNLLQNAFKFTKHGTAVTLSVIPTPARVLFDVSDHCGGLPQGDASHLFLPFEQQGADRTGIGLGLAICMKTAKASGGDLRVQDIPGEGCIFTLDLPRVPTPPLKVISNGHVRVQTAQSKKTA